MRDNNGIRRGIVEEITRGERGEKNENIALIAKFRIMMMTLKRIRDPNQTIYLATSTEGMEENPGPDLQPQ